MSSLIASGVFFALAIGASVVLWSGAWVYAALFGLCSATAAVHAALVFRGKVKYRILAIGIAVAALSLVTALIWSASIL